MASNRSARSLAHDGDPVLQTGGVEMGQLDFGRVAVMAEPGQPRDIGHRAGQLQHPSPVAADEQRDVHSGRGDQRPRVGAHTIMRAVDVDGLAGKQRPDHLHRLDEPVDPRPAGVERDACGVVLGLHVTRRRGRARSGLPKSLRRSRPRARRRQGDAGRCSTPACPCAGGTWPPRPRPHPRTATATRRDGRGSSARQSQRPAPTLRTRRTPCRGAARYAGRNEADVSGGLRRQRSWLRR